MIRPVILIGCGGHAKVLADAIRLAGGAILGVVTQEASAPGETRFGLPALGDDAALEGFDPDEVELVNGVGSVGDPGRRVELYERFAALGFRFARVIHPAAVAAQDALLGPGAQVMAGAVVQPGVRTGENVIINTAACVDHDCVVGGHVHIATGAVLAGGVVVGEKAHVGAGATVIQSVRIGERAIVAAGAVVVRDVAPGTTVMGAPAKVRT